jgi:hypothetical protein
MMMLTNRRRAAWGATWLVVMAFSAACGPRLKRPADAPTAAGEAPAVDAPIAKMTLQLDASKVDASRKYTQSGQLMVDGLFFKDGLSHPATVKVTVHDADGKVSRAYDIELADLAGTSAKVEMWDDGLLSVLMAPSGTPPQFQTSNTNVKAVEAPVPGKPGEVRACYYGKEVLEGQIRFALCNLQTPTPVMTFVDVETEAPAAAPAAPTATPETAPAPAPVNK